MIDFQAILSNRTKRYLLIYSRHVYAVRQMHTFFDLAKQYGATVCEATHTVKFDEGGFAKFDHCDGQFYGLQVDDYFVDEVVSSRLDSLPLLTLLATRKRP